MDSISLSCLKIADIAQPVYVMHGPSNVATTFKNDAVEEVFRSYPDHIRPHVLFLRQLIFETAAETEGVGELEETLKWGEPSYLTSTTKSGSTIRIDWKARQPDRYAMYFICHTNLVNTFREIYADQLAFDGNRSIVFKVGADIPVDALSHCISMALTYHLDKNK